MSVTDIGSRSGRHTAGKDSQTKPALLTSAGRVLQAGGTVTAEARRLVCALGLERQGKVSVGGVLSAKAGMGKIIHDLEGHTKDFTLKV